MITASELSARLGYTYSGDENAVIIGISYANACTKGKLAVAVFRKEAYSCCGDTILTDKLPIVFGKNIIYSTDNINTAIVRAAKLLIECGVCKDYSIQGRLEAVGDHMQGSGVQVGENTAVGAFTVIESGCIIGKNCRIGNNAFIGADTVIGDNTVIGDGTRISAASVFHGYEGKYLHLAGVGRTVIGNDVFIGSNTVIQRGTLNDTVIGNGSVIGDLVDIGHDCDIAENCRIVSQSGISGNVTIGKGTVIYGQSGAANFVKIGKNVTVMARTAVTKNIGDNKTISGAFGRQHSEELRLNAKIRKFFNGRN